MTSQLIRNGLHSSKNTITPKSLFLIAKTVEWNTPKQRQIFEVTNPFVYLLTNPKVDTNDQTVRQMITALESFKEFGKLIKHVSELDDNRPEPESDSDFTSLSITFSINLHRVDLQYSYNRTSWVTSPFDPTIALTEIRPAFLEGLLESSGMPFLIMNDRNVPAYLYRELEFRFCRWVELLMALDGNAENQNISNFLLDVAETMRSDKPDYDLIHSSQMGITLARNNFDANGQQMVTQLMSGLPERTLCIMAENFKSVEEANSPFKCQTYDPDTGTIRNSDVIDKYVNVRLNVRAVRDASNDGKFRSYTVKF